MNISELTSLHMTNPIDIDVTPYFSWKIESPRPDFQRIPLEYQLLFTQGVWYTGNASNLK